MHTTDLILPLTALLMGAFGAWLIASNGYRFALLDSPNERSSHSKPTPKGGGVGLLATFIVASLWLEVSPSLWISISILGVLCLFVDRFHFSPKLRLAFQFSVAFVVLAATWQEEITKIHFILLMIPLSIFIVGTANIYNFMDGINGIAAITGIVGFGLLAFCAFAFESSTSFAALSACIALSCLGFLPFNMPNAKVFMGDVGSVLLGFAFASLVVLLSKTFLDFVCLASFLFPFYADELTTMAVRIKDGENLLKPHRRHLYQLLANEQGMAHWKISLGYGLMQLVIGLTVLLAKPHGILPVLSILFAYFTAFIFVSFSVRRRLTQTGEQSF
jgi:Fuc2NAc and GlcNAc transferase